MPFTIVVSTKPAVNIKVKKNNNSYTSYIIVNHQLEVFVSAIFLKIKAIFMSPIIGPL